MTLLEAIQAVRELGPEAWSAELHGERLVSAVIDCNIVEYLVHTACGWDTTALRVDELLSDKWQVVEG